MKEEEKTSECATLGRSGGETDECFGEKVDQADSQSETESSGDLTAPTIQIFQIRNNEAPLSPSAYRSFHGQRIAASLDHTVAPSPPCEQHEIQHFRSNRSFSFCESATVKDTKKKIRSTKLRIKQFDDEYQQDHGYRPSYEQKMRSPIASQLLHELSEYRKILKELKEDAKMGRNAVLYAERFCMEMQMRDRKYFVGRSESIEDINIDQLFQEKLDLQKSLLKYDTDVGLASKKDYKTFIKPVSDRCRTIRNVVAKIPKSKDSSDLQPILEHVAMNFSSPSHSLHDSFSKTDLTDEIMDNLDPNNNDSLSQPLDKLEEQNDGDKSESSLKETDSSSSSSSSSYVDGDKSSPNVCYNLHALPFSELIKELHQTLQEKQELRQSIKVFEERQRAEGKKLDKETKSEFQSTYSLYKALKKKARLLEALISKYEKQSESK